MLRQAFRLKSALLEFHPGGQVPFKPPIKAKNADTDEGQVSSKNLEMLTGAPLGTALSMFLIDLFVKCLLHYACRCRAATLPVFLSYIKSAA